MSRIELVGDPVVAQPSPFSATPSNGASSDSSMLAGSHRGPAHSQEKLLDMGAGRHGFKGASFWSAVFNLVTTVVGAGIMGLPATMRALGIPLGIVALVAMALLTQVSLEMLIKTTTVQQVWSYGDLVDQECGSKWRLVLDVSVVINNFGLCIVYLIIIADVLSGTWSSVGSAHPGVLREWSGGSDEWWNSRFIVLAAVTLLVILPLAAMRHVDSLKYTSFISVLLALVFLVVILVITVIKLAKGTLPTPRWVPFVQAPNFLAAVCSVFPILATAYACHFNIHPIYVELKDRTEQNMTSVTRVALASCFGIYLLTTLTGYLLFGDNTASDVLANFDRPILEGVKGLNDVVRLSYALHVALVFPVIYYSLRNTTDELLFPNAAKSLAEDTVRFWGITVTQLVLVFVGATLVPNIWMAFDITGATSTMIIGMIFPAVLALRDKSGVIASWEKKTGYGMVVWAAIICVTSLASTIYFIVKGIASQPGSQQIQG